MPREPRAKKEVKAVVEEHSDEGEEPKKKKKPKVKKDPNAPKRYVLVTCSTFMCSPDTSAFIRAMSAFMFYSMAQRDNVKTTHPDLGFGKSTQMRDESPC